MNHRSSDEFSLTALPYCSHFYISFFTCSPVMSTPVDKPPPGIRMILLFEKYAPFIAIILFIVLVCLSGAFLGKVYSRPEVFGPPYSPYIKPGTVTPLIIVCFLFVLLETTNQESRHVSVQRCSPCSSLCHKAHYGGWLVLLLGSVLLRVSSLLQSFNLAIYLIL